MFRSPLSVSRSAFASLVLILLTSTTANADIIKEFTPQSGVAEDFGLRRAVYLGRLFNGVDGGPFRRMDSMYAIVTLAQATNVQLFAGDGNSNFDTALSQGKMVDTGIRVSNSNQTDTQVVFVPGSPSNTPPFKIGFPAGVAIHDSLATNNRLDFWLVGITNSGFTVPASVSGNVANFFIQFERSTAVPEPASILLAGSGFIALLARRRFRLSN
jgi:PEP-CTERM motif